MIKLCGNWFINMAVAVDSYQQMGTYTRVTMVTCVHNTLDWRGSEGVYVQTEQLIPYSNFEKKGIFVELL